MVVNEDETWAYAVSQEWRVNVPSYWKPEPKQKRNPRAEWAQEKSAWLALHPHCQGREYGLDHQCDGPVQVHHRLPRGAGGSRQKLPLATLCMWAHQWVEKNREQARNLGLLVRRTP